MRRGREDPVRPEVREYVLRRDEGCVVGILSMRLAIARDVGICRDQYGNHVSVFDLRDRTIAHVRDRGLGGRMAKRPPSVPRHLAAVCYGHHIADPIIDRPDVRDVVDAYLESLEGATASSVRPWERIARVRGRDDG